MSLSRKLILLCGLSATGKSKWADFILDLLKDEQPVYCDIDKVRESTWPPERRKNLKAEEHRFKNEATRFEVKKTFILGARTVVLNMVMPTKKLHQKPFMDMVHDTERILTEIEKDYGRLEKDSQERVEIDIRALWFDCNEEAARKRLEERARASHESDLTDIKVWLGNKSWFEVPDGENYKFIRIDTSDESPEADRGRERVIASFTS